MNLSNNVFGNNSPDAKTDEKMRELEVAVNLCSDVLAVADRFLLDNAVNYVAGLLSYLYLNSHSCHAIFLLACFYKLDLLAADCARESLLSEMPPCDVVTLYRDLARHGYTQLASRALIHGLKPFSELTIS